MEGINLVQEDIGRSLEMAIYARSPVPGELTHHSDMGVHQDLFFCYSTRPEEEESLLGWL